MQILIRWLDLAVVRLAQLPRDELGRGGMEGTAGVWMGRGEKGKGGGGVVWMAGSGTGPEAAHSRCCGLRVNLHVIINERPASGACSIFQRRSWCIIWLLQGSLETGGQQQQQYDLAFRRRHRRHRRYCRKDNGGAAAN